MDPRLQSSFIPKKPIMNAPRTYHAPLSIFSIVSVSLFILTILGSVGVFLYQNYLNNEIAAASSSLHTEQDEFDQSTIEQLARLDSRLTVAQGLLQKHVAVSNFFSALEDVTLPTARFSNFAFSVGAQNALTISMNGEAESFTSVALQSDALISDTYFKNVMVSDFSVEQSGAVSFTVTMTLDPSLVAYGTVPSQPSGGALGGTTNTSVVPVATTTQSNVSNTTTQ
ncbi:MAG TPA: hypothetical protein VMR73_01545 [Candidatus Paceibacterota bacterium]|nr:hypothetical protein [Candidatus Paceibacterota bacterium]